jgi:hypothetical protein
LAHPSRVLNRVTFFIVQQDKVVYGARLRSIDDQPGSGRRAAFGNKPVWSVREPILPEAVRVEAARVDRDVLYEVAGGASVDVNKLVPFPYVESGVVALFAS